MRMTWIGVLCFMVIGSAWGGNQSAVRQRIEAFWAREDRFEAALELELAGRVFALHPLPHPSPANALWAKRFPQLLRGRLERLGHSSQPLSPSSP